MRNRFKPIFFTIVMTLGFIFLFPVEDKAEAAVYWDGVVLKKGQIGRMTILENTSLFKLDGEKRTFSRTLKKGENYRIYAFKPGMLSVGGGYYVDRNNKIKYETPSKAKLAQVQYGIYQSVSSIKQEIAFIDNQITYYDYNKYQYPTYSKEYRDILQIQIDLLNKKGYLLSLL